LRQPKAGGNTSDVDVQHQLLSHLAEGDVILDGPPPDVPLPDFLLLDIPLPDVPLPDVPLPEVCPDESVGEE